MPRIKRISHAGLVWHITQRCHQRSFLLKFAKDRRRWMHWLFQARKRYGLCVLNYVVTSNHIHLLVRDQGRSEIETSMQLVAGRTAQEYNSRKKRCGAFWQDRYHATAVQTDEHLFRCLLYIDLNMVRAGAVQHPGEWHESGFHEGDCPPIRKNRLDQAAIIELFCYPSFDAFMKARKKRIQQALAEGLVQRNPIWTDSVAVGTSEFLLETQLRLGHAGRYRTIHGQGDDCMLQDSRGDYVA